MQKETFDKIQEKKNLKNLGIEENLVNLIKEVWERVNSAVLCGSKSVQSQERPVSMTALCLAPGN